MSTPTPIYLAKDCKAAYQLNWSLAVFWRGPAIAADRWLDRVQQDTERDGVRILEHRQKSPSVSQFLVSTQPQSSPAEIVRSVKGRLQYVIRTERPQPFQRNYSIASVGSASREVIDEYLRTQTDHHPMADPRTQQLLEKYQIHRPEVDLGKPRRSSHGEFLHNLQVVLVREGRHSEVREEVLLAVQRMVLGASQKKGHLLSRCSLLSDHIHLMLGCGVDESPEQVALGYMNNLAYAQRRSRVYGFGFYVGTVGEYDLGAIRQALRE